MRRPGGDPRPADPRHSRWRAIAIALLALALVAAACSGDDDAPEGDDEAAGQEDGGDGDGTIAVDASLTLVDPSGDSLFGCLPGGGSDARVAYLDTDGPESGPNAERMRVLIGDYNRRCGTTIEVVPFVTPAGAATDDCDVVLAAEPVLTIASDPTIATVECLADSGSPVWSEGSLPSNLIEDAGALVLSTEAPSDVTADLQVRLLLGEGLVEGTSVTVLHQGSAETSPVADAFEAAFTGAGATVSTIEVGDACDVAAAEPAWVSATVATVVDVDCQLALVEAASAAAVTPRWLVYDLQRSVVDGVADFAALSRTFDVALAYSASPTIGAGWPRALDPHARDAACNTYLDRLLGTDTVYPTVEWHTGARLCSTAQALLQVLDAAGPGPDAGALEDAFVTVTQVPFPRGQIGGFGEGKPWVGPAQLFALEWSADCGCWTHVNGPLAAG